MFLIQSPSHYQLKSFPDIAAIAYPPPHTDWFLAEDEPLDVLLKRFKRTGLAALMTTPVRNVQPSPSQTRTPPQTRSQSQLPEESSSGQEEDIVNAADYLTLESKALQRLNSPRLVSLLSLYRQ